MFGNPQGIFYSLPQFLSFIVDPWLAIQLSMFFVLLAGYAGWFLFGRSVLMFSRAMTHIFALLIIVNGNYLVRMLVGHVGFHSLPLVGILLWLIFEKRKDSTCDLCNWKTGLFALVASYILYSGGFYVLVLTGTIIVCLLPADLLLWRTKRISRARILLKRLFAFGIFSILLGLAKIIAVYSYMRFFSRSIPYETSAHFSNAILNILRAFWGMPQGLGIFQNIKYGLHEYSIFLSPIILVGLILGSISTAKKYGRRQIPAHLLAAIAYGLFLAILFIQFAQGDGFFVSLLSRVPILSSLRVTFRLIIVAGLLVTIVGACGLAKWIDTMPLSKYASTAIIISGAITLIGLLTAYAFPIAIAERQFGITFPYDSMLVLQERHNDYLNKSVSNIINWRSRGKTELQHLYSGTTGLDCYEPLLRRDERATIFSELSEGSIFSVKNEHFNLLHPACLQYPWENDCFPGERIRENDWKDIEAFRLGNRTTWKIPLYQKASNWISLLTLLFCLYLVTTRCGGFNGKQKVQ